MVDRDLERLIASREEWVSAPVFARLLVEAGQIEISGSYWIALQELRRLESEGKVERFRPDHKHAFEFWRWKGEA